MIYDALRAQSFTLLFSWHRKWANSAGKEYLGFSGFRNDYWNYENGKHVITGAHDHEHKGITVTYVIFHGHCCILPDICQLTSCDALQIFEFIMCDQYSSGVAKSSDAIGCNRPVISHGACFCTHLSFVLKPHCFLCFFVNHQTHTEKLPTLVAKSY